MSTGSLLPVEGLNFLWAPYTKGPPYHYKGMSVYRPAATFRINFFNCLPVAFSVDMARGMYTLTVVGQISFEERAKPKNSKTKRRKK